MGSISLEVGGLRYSGWEAMQVSDSLESISGSFSLNVAANLDIEEEDPCVVRIDDQLVLTGHIERINPTFNETTDDFTASGNSKAYALAKCSANLDRWLFRNANVFDIAKKVAEPYGIDVSAQQGLELAPAPRKLAITPGDTGFDVILAAAKASGVHVVSTPEGGIRLTRTGTQRASDALVEGENIVAGSGNYDASDRFYRYIALAQTSGTDRAFGDATRLRSQAFDVDVKRQEQTLILRPEAGHSVAYNKSYADWQARIRAANARSAQVQVEGWTQTDGSLWRKNQIVAVRSPRLRINGDMLIAQCDYVKDEGGEVTNIRIVRTDAYLPSPSARVKE